MGCAPLSCEQEMDTQVPPTDVPSRSSQSSRSPSRGRTVSISRYPQLTPSRSNSKEKKEYIDWIPTSNRIFNIREILDIHEELGVGSTCKVFRASRRTDDEEEPAGSPTTTSTTPNTTQQVAVKQLARPRRTKVARREVDLLCGLSHPNILRCEDVYADRSNIWMVMEYCSGGSLIQHLKDQDHGLDEAYAKSLMRQITNAVEYLHAKGIVHRDIKPDNIVFADASKTRIVLIDFGTADHLDMLPQMLHDWAGTPAFMSPEVFVERSREDLLGIDVWALGVSCYIMLTGYFPFFGRDLRSIQREVVRKKVAFPKGMRISRESRDFCCRCLLKNKFARMTARAALDHVWLQEE